MENIGWVIFACIFTIAFGLFFLNTGIRYKRKVRAILHEAPIYQAKIIDIHSEKSHRSGRRPSWVYYATLEFETKEYGVVQHRLNLGEDHVYADEVIGTYKELYYDPTIFPQPKHSSELEINKSGTSASVFFGVVLILIGIIEPIIIYW